MHPRELVTARITAGKKLRLQEDARMRENKKEEKRKIQDNRSACKCKPPPLGWVFPTVDSSKEL